MENSLMLLAVGTLAGAMNALAGGGSFVTLPALILAGVPSTVANATSRTLEAFMVATPLALGRARP